jgi:hypothetical protein
MTTTTLVRLGEGTPYLYYAQLDKALRAAEGDIELYFQKMHVHTFPSFRGLRIVSLVLDGCEVPHLEDLVAALEGNDTLRTLKLYNMHLDSADLASLGSLRCGVQRLELRSCGVRDTWGGERELAALVDLPLQALVLRDLHYYYGFAQKIAEDLPITESIERTETLQELDIGGTHDFIAKAVCEGLFKNRSIHTLTLTRPCIPLNDALAFSNRSLLQVNFVDHRWDRVFVDNWLTYNMELKEAKKSMAALVFAWEQGNETGLGMLPKELFIHIKGGLFPTVPEDFP